MLEVQELERFARGWGGAVYKSNSEEGIVNGSDIDQDGSDSDCSSSEVEISSDSNSGESECSDDVTSEDESVQDSKLT